MIDGSQQAYVVQSGLPYADNLVTVYAFNIKRGRGVQGPSQIATHRSLAIGEFDIMQAGLHVAHHHLFLLSSQWLQSLLR